MIDEQGKYAPPPGAIRFKFPMKATVWAVEQPARARTVLVKNIVRYVKNRRGLMRERIESASGNEGALPFRMEFPRLVFLVGTVQGRVMHVGLAGLRKDKKFYRHSRLLTAGMQNMIFSNMVCYGTAWQAIYAGKIDPVDAWWNTRFDHGHVGIDYAEDRRIPYKVSLSLTKKHHVTLADFAYLTACYSAAAAPIVLRYSQAEIAAMPRVSFTFFESTIDMKIHDVFDLINHWPNIVARRVDIDAQSQ